MSPSRRNRSRREAARTTTRGNNFQTIPAPTADKIWRRYLLQNGAFNTGRPGETATRRIECSVVKKPIQAITIN
ncbi:MAG: hypothetical protein H0W77_09060 [Acidobacteria bacterium]|nr:hypothetical protein [Acidobacteriota bacterium]